jgi:hypothetical protein
LKGEVKISLLATIPAAAKAKTLSDSLSRLTPVIVQSQHFVLKLPFMESNGTSKVSEISPSEIVTTNNRIELTFLLTNDWIRNCYGVLSIEGFQSTRASININTCFRGLGAAQKMNLVLLPAVAFLQLDLVKNDRAINSAAFNVTKQNINHRRHTD